MLIFFLNAPKTFLTILFFHVVDEENNEKNSHNMLVFPWNCKGLTMQSRATSGTLCIVGMMQNFALPTCQKIFSFALGLSLLTFSLSGSVSQNPMVCAKQAMGCRWRAWASILLVFPVWGRENLEVRREDPEYQREVRLGGSPLPLDHQVAIYIQDNHAKRSLVHALTYRSPWPINRFSRWDACISASMARAVLSLCKAVDYPNWGRILGPKLLIFMGRHALAAKIRCHNWGISWTLSTCTSAYFNWCDVQPHHPRRW